MKTTTLALVASGADGASFPVTSSEVEADGLRSQNGVLVVCVDATTTSFDIDIEGAVEPGGDFHPILTLTQAGAILMADGSQMCSFAEFPLFPVLRSKLHGYVTAGTGYLQVLVRE